MIEISRLSKRFGGNRVLRELDLSLQAGEVTALFGPNGAGKTTLIRLLCELERSDGGQIRLLQDGRVFELITQKHAMGVILHQPLLYEALTPRENLRFYAGLYGLTDANTRIDALLERTGLARTANQSVHIFSRGMKQRLALARALLHKPRILLLDEPYTGLDRDGCALVNTILKEETASGSLILLTSHDFDNVAAAADRFVVLAGGRISDSLRNKNCTPAELEDFYNRALQAVQPYTTGALA